MCPPGNHCLFVAPGTPHQVTTVFSRRTRYTLGSAVILHQVTLGTGIPYQVTTHTYITLDHTPEAQI